MLIGVKKNFGQIYQINLQKMLVETNKYLVEWYRDLVYSTQTLFHCISKCNYLFNAIKLL